MHDFIKSTNWKFRNDKGFWHIARKPEGILKGEGMYILEALLGLIDLSEGAIHETQFLYPAGLEAYIQININAQSLVCSII